MSKSGTEDISARPKKLSLHERAQLAIAERRKGAPAAPRQQLIFRRDSNAPAPLSFAQQRLWFLDQFEPGSSAYNMPAALRLTGQLDVASLRQTFGELARRHEVLRATFVEENGRPVQIIAPYELRPLPITDLSGLSEDERETELRRLVAAERQQPFDLGQGPLMRVVLLRLAEQSHVLLVTMHHIIADGWSVGVLIRELTALYTAYEKGEESPLAELPIQYADYAAWQREQLSGKTLEAHLAYWEKHLAGAPPSLELPTDYPRPPVRSFLGTRDVTKLPASLTRELRALSLSEGATMYMTLLTAFKLLLHRLTAQEDIIVGTPIAGRTQGETEGLIGFFVNTLALRTDLSGDPSFRALLGRVRESTLGAYTHQDLPFELLVERLQPERSLNHTPLFQVFFNMITLSEQGGGLVLTGLKIEMLDTPEYESKFDLTLYVEEQKEDIKLLLISNADLFSRARGTEILRRFERLLTQIVGDPNRRVSRLELLSPAEREWALTSLNRTARDYPRQGSLHELFEAQAALSPDADAVICEGVSLSYAELNRRANQLAHYLRSLGVGLESLVPLCVERSVELFVGLLGILKAGAAYAPLDPAAPKERMQAMLEALGAPVVVTRHTDAGNLPPHPARVLLDADRPLISQLGAENLALAVMPEAAAYVIFTSGSTGRPKGVVVEQRQILNYHRAVVERVRLGAGLRFAMVQPLTVDSAQTMLFPALCTGGAVHVITRERAGDPEALMEYFDAQQIDCLKIAPSHLAALQGGRHAERLLPRHSLIIGGEASRWEWAEALIGAGANGAGEGSARTDGARADGGRESSTGADGGEANGAREGCAVYNHYGPTEATVGMLMFRLGHDSDAVPAGGTPLGRPLGNTRAYVLDAHGQPVPAGVPGELYIGGACVARGYAGEAAKTAERFVPDPFAPELGARLYRTGDVVRRLTDGNLLFVGRNDQQVKIRGFRIELGEIEEALRRQAGVREALVVAREDGRGSQQLVAYVVAQGEGDEAEGGGHGWVARLRARLAEQVPEYMMPAAYVRMEALPLSAHGKVNLQGLPAPEAVGTGGEDDYVAPGTELEQGLARIWEELLKVERVSVEANFFTLGGHSLLATQLLSRVRSELGAQLPLRRIFERPTVRELAAHIEATRLLETADEEAIWRAIEHLEELPEDEANQLLAKMLSED